MWDDPEEFKPERFPLDGPVPTEQNTDYRYIPFSAGPRCIPNTRPPPDAPWMTARAPVLVVLARVNLLCARPSWVLSECRLHPPRGCPFRPCTEAERLLRRKCVGDQFALMEAVVALAMVLRRYSFRAVPNREPGMTTGGSSMTGIRCQGPCPAAIWILSPRQLCRSSKHPYWYSRQFTVQLHKHYDTKV